MSRAVFNEEQLKAVERCEVEIAGQWVAESCGPWQRRMWWPFPAGDGIQVAV